ncbi:MAG: hypothetical protein LBR94_09375 [Desulfovibrio sp.]|nr:hypothetical protein [Desulfovibrio sp.]
MNTEHYLGALLVLLVISALGLYSGMRVKSAGDFSVGGRRAGALVSAFLIPLIGLAGVAVGLYMKIHMPQINPSTALPVFIIEKFPPFFAA